MYSNDTERASLFLHMGPGFNAYTERVILGEANRAVVFWDQPVIEDATDAFGQLLKAAADKLEEIFEHNKCAVDLIAHSFGAYLAIELLESHPHMINRLKIFNSSYDIVDGYLSLLKKMSEATQDLELKVKIDTLLVSNPKNLETKSLFDEIISLVAQDPLYLRFYFASSSGLEVYLNVAANAEPINIAMFKNVMVDYVDNHFKIKKGISTNKIVELILGGPSDPFFTPQCEELWRSHFPDAVVELKNNIGHFVHLSEGYEGKII